MHKLDFSKIKQTLEKSKEHKPVGASSGSGGNRKFYRVPKDTQQFKVRFLPPYNEKGEPAKEISYHYSIICPDELAQASQYPPSKILCLVPFGMECPFCEMLKEFDGRMDLDKWAASRKAFANVLVIEDQAFAKRHTNEALNPKEPRIMGFSGNMKDWLYQSLIDEDIGDITDPKTGANVILKRKSDGGAFEKTVARGQSPIAPTDEEIEQILGQMYDLDKINAWLPPDDNGMKKIHQITEATRESFKKRLGGLTSGNATPGPQHPGETANSMETSPGANQGAPPQAAPQPTQSVGPSAPPQQQQAQQPQPQTQPQQAAPAQQASQQAPASSPSPQSGQSAQAPSSSENSNKPPNAPDCFGDPNVYSPENTDCLMCPYEYNCEQTVNSSGG